MMFRPRAIASCASSQTRVSASSIASAPSATGQVMSMVMRLEDVVRDGAQRLELVVAQDRLVEHQLVRVLGLSSSRLPSAPSPAPMLITMSSRIGSIGGLVTCANSCLK